MGCYVDPSKLSSSKSNNTGSAGCILGDTECFRPSQSNRKKKVGIFLFEDHHAPPPPQPRNKKKKIDLKIN